MLTPLPRRLSKRWRGVTWFFQSDTKGGERSHRSGVCVGVWRGGGGGLTSLSPSHPSLQAAPPGTTPPLCYNNVRDQAHQKKTCFSDWSNDYRSIEVHVFSWKCNEFLLLILTNMTEKSRITLWIRKVLDRNERTEVELRSKSIYWVFRVNTVKLGIRAGQR